MSEPLQSSQQDLLLHTQQTTSLTKYNINVLLVDDQLMIAEAVRRMLANYSDIKFHYCQDPSKAIQTAIEISPTIILQDLVMPDIDGWTLVKFYRSHPKIKNIPVIVLSSKEEPEIKADLFALGANDYIVKLPNPKELIARIRYHSKGYINFLERNDAYKRLADDLERAKDYVLSLVPEPIKEGTVQTDWSLIPSTELGGDSFGYHWIDENYFAIYLLDVCSHGVGPALLSVSVLNLMRSGNLPNIDFRQPEQVLYALNESFQMSAQNNLYFTMWYGVYNKQEHELKYASAGHPPALLFSEAGEPLELITPNFIVGGIPSYQYANETIKIPKNANLYVFSDGVYEIQKPDKAMWTLAELKVWLAEKQPGNGSEITGLYEFLKDMSGLNDLEDDFSMMRIQFE